MSTKGGLPDALIGFSGFVGSTLLKQKAFHDLYRSTNIEEIRGREFDTIICAGAPAQKWIANSDPVADKAKIDLLTDCLGSVRCRQFILVSTVDVFSFPLCVTEDSAVTKTNLQPYGLHRWSLEKTIREKFERTLVVRLPGLVGPGLRKNIVFDLLNDNNLSNIDPRGIFQFYPMVNLYKDIEIALANNLALIHLTAEPISVEEVARHGFGKSLITSVRSETPPRYDFRTKYANLFGMTSEYQYTKREVLIAIRSYAQSEPIQNRVEEQR